MKSLVKRSLAMGLHLYWRSRFAALKVPRSSTVAYWRLRGHAGGLLIVGEESSIEARLTIERPGARVDIGERTYVGNCVMSCAQSIKIGSDVMIAWGATIFDHGSHSVQFSKRAMDVRNWNKGEKDWSVVEIRPIQIGDKAWVGYGSIVLPGISIGEGAVVGAGSVVTRDVPAWTVVAGNPARTIRQLSEDER